PSIPRPVRRDGCRCLDAPNSLEQSVRTGGPPDRLRDERLAGMTDYPNACTISYRRSRFSTRLPPDRRYTPSHFWVLEEGPGLWRVGFTKSATRMLGDLVEYGFEVKPGATVSLGETIGWIEGFKATTDLFCVASGAFRRTNTDLETDPTLLDGDPYGRGWLY